MTRYGPPYVYKGPPFDTIADEIRWDLHQASGKLRKLRGLPSTKDIEVLSEFLMKVSRFASYSLMMEVTRVGISLPELPNLSYEDYEEVIQLSGLEVLKSYKTYGHPVKDVNAAWAGLGYGLCEHWRDVERCEEEEELIEPKIVLALVFTEEELSIRKTYVENAHYTYTILSATHRDLGYKSWSISPDNSTFWDLVEKSEASVVNTYPEYRIQDVILMGEYAEDKMFLDAVWKALEDVADVQNLSQPLKVSGFDATFVAARGAAELADDGKVSLGIVWRGIGVIIMGIIERKSECLRRYEWVSTGYVQKIVRGKKYLIAMYRTENNESWP